MQWVVSHDDKMRPTCTTHGLPCFACCCSQDMQNADSLNWMFRGAAAFNQDIASWNVANVTEMQGIFERATSFNQDLSSWSVERVVTMADAFNGASAFNQDLCAWDEKLDAATSVAGNAFSGTACPSTESPVLNGIPPGPYCHVCGGGDLKKFQTREELDTAIAQYLGGANVSAISTTYGYPMNNWNVGKITDFKALFSATALPGNSSATFSEDLSRWVCIKRNTTTTPLPLFLNERTLHRVPVPNSRLLHYQVARSLTPTLLFRSFLEYELGHDDT